MEFHLSSDIKINLEDAITEHRSYVDLLKYLIGSDNVVELDTDNNLADSCFVEDPVIIIDKKVCLNRTGALSRRRETDAFREYFTVVI